MKLKPYCARLVRRGKTRFGIEAVISASIIVMLMYPFFATAGDVKILDDGSVAIWARTDLIKEAPITLTHNGLLVNDPSTPSLDFFDGIEIFDRVPGTNSFPLTWVDLIGNCYFRATYQNSDGTTGNLGSSVVACPSYRISGGDLQFIPTVTTANVETGFLSGERIETTLSANYGMKAIITSIRTYPEPAEGLTCMSVHVKIDVRQAISLDASQLGNDAFRFVTVSSMFASRTVYDANVLRWETPTGQVKMFRLKNTTPRDIHLLAPGTSLGCWFELVKEAGSIWYSDSPSIRVEITDCDNVNQHIGLQCFLAASRDPNDDSLSIWLEWLDVPNPIPAGTSSSLSLKVLATAPRRPPVVPSGVLLLLGQP